jgi:hypothetical protein
MEVHYCLLGPPLSGAVMCQPSSPIWCQYLVQTVWNQAVDIKNSPWGGSRTIVEVKGKWPAHVTHLCLHHPDMLGLLFCWFFVTGFGSPSGFQTLKPKLDIKLRLTWNSRSSCLSIKGIIINRDYRYKPPYVAEPYLFFPSFLPFLFLFLQYLNPEPHTC